MNDKPETTEPKRRPKSNYSFHFELKSATGKTLKKFTILKKTRATPAHIKMMVEGAILTVGDVFDKD